MNEDDGEKWTRDWINLNDTTDKWWEEKVKQRVFTIYLASNDDRPETSEIRGKISRMIENSSQPSITRLRHIPLWKRVIQWFRTT